MYTLVCIVQLAVVTPKGKWYRKIKALNFNHVLKEFLTALNPCYNEPWADNFVTGVNLWPDYALD